MILSSFLSINEKVTRIAYLTPTTPIYNPYLSPTPKLYNPPKIRDNQSHRYHPCANSSLKQSLQDWKRDLHPKLILLSLICSVNFVFKLVFHTVRCELVFQIRFSHKSVSVLFFNHYCHNPLFSIFCYLYFTKPIPYEANYPLHLSHSDSFMSPIQLRPNHHHQYRRSRPNLTRHHILRHERSRFA